MRQESNYDLEINRVLREIKEQRAKKVLLQFPEGLKSQAFGIVKEIESKSKAECFIWLGSCYGACDLPDLHGAKIDLLVQFGHSEFGF